MKNAMKMLLCLLLVACMALSMVACGGKEKEDAKATDPAKTEEKNTTNDSDTTEAPSSEDETPSENETPTVSGDSLAGTYGAVFMIPTSGIEEILNGMLEAMEVYDVEISDLNNVSELNFGYVYAVEATDDTMSFAYDYESTKEVYDEFRAGLYAAMWQALELEAEFYGATWEDMEQACQDAFGMDVDGYINYLLDTAEPEYGLESQEDAQSTYSYADGSILLDGEEMECTVDGGEIYISVDGELVIYMTAG